MRFVKRRDPACRRPAKPEGTIIFHTAATANWRERVRALKAAQELEQSKDEPALSRFLRP
jgi:hypothetical protein